MSEKLMIFADKMGSNRYLGGIRDGFILAVPLTISAAFAVLINNVLFANNLPYALTNPEYWGPNVIETVTKIKFIFSSIEFGSLNIISYLVVIGIAFTLSKASNVKNPIQNALIVFGIFYSLFPKGALAGAYFESQWAAGFGEMENAVNLAGLSGAANLFTALVVGVLFTELLIKLQSFKALEIKLPDQVPPMVANSFSALIPAFLSFLIAGILAYFFMMVAPAGYNNLSAFISGMIQAPFLALAGTSIGGWGIMLIYVFFANFFWVFGIHGPNVLAGFSQPTLGVLGQNNQQIYAQMGDAYSDELSVFTAGFVDAYVQMGGSGATMGLIIAIFLVSKRADYKAIANLAVAPGMFEINEPITFGIPIVLNPILGIPFVLAPLASVILPGILTSIGWLPKIVISVPWVTPPALGAFLATGASWKAGLVALINIGISFLIYLPFVLMANKEVDEEVVE